MCRALHEDGYDIVWVPVSPRSKRDQTLDLDWGSTDPVKRKAQIAYLKRVLPADVLAMNA